MATSQQPSTSVVRVESAAPIERAKDVAPFVTFKAKAALEPMLKPLGVSYDQFLSEIYFAVQKTPELRNCTPESLVMAAHRILVWGFTIGEKAWMVPFGDVATAVRGYQGDAELVVNAGGAKFLDAFNFYANEPIEHQQGSNPYVKHQPLSVARRGALVGSYAVAIISASLPPKIKLMYNDEIDQIRQKYSKQWKKGTLDSLPSHFYGPKTCIKQICKLLPTNARMAKVFQSFDEEELPISIDSVTGAELPSGERVEAPPGEPAKAAAPAAAEDDGMKF